MSSPESTRDHEVQQLLVEALDQQARTLVPDTRPPALAWPDPAPARRRWVAPLGVAAAVAAVGVAAAMVLGHRSAPVPAPAPETETTTVEPTPVTTSNPPATVTSPPTSTSAEPTTPAPSPTSSPTSLAGTAFDAFGGQLVVPPGWIVAPGRGPAFRCIGRSGSTDCPIEFIWEAGTSGLGLDSDSEGGGVGNPHYCARGYTSRRLVDYRDTTLGGRVAEYRAWRWVCPEGTQADIAQYTVVTPEPSVLFSDHATDEVKDVMSRVAAASRLPAATGSVRLYDRGILRAARPDPSGGTIVSLDRVIAGAPNTSSATYDYLVPSSVMDTTRLRAIIGGTVVIRTDGSVAIDLVGPVPDTFP